MKCHNYVIYFSLPCDGCSVLFLKIGIMKLKKQGTSFHKNYDSFKFGFMRIIKTNFQILTENVYFYVVLTFSSGFLHRTSCGHCGGYRAGGYEKLFLLKPFQELENG